MLKRFGLVMRRAVCVVLFGGLAASLAAAAEAPKPAGVITDAKSYQKLVAEQKGKVVLVSIWATWCPYCRQEFADLVRLSKELAGKPFALVSVTVDSKETWDSRVGPFLEKHGAKFPVYLAEPDKPGALLQAIDPKWDGGIPAHFIYNDEGKRVISAVGASSFEEMLARVKPLLPKTR